MFGSDISKRIQRDFGESAAAIAQELENFIGRFRQQHQTHPGDRVVRCIVHLAAGKRAHLDHYVKAALRDPRDVMAWAEYDERDTRLHDFNMPFRD